MRSSRFGVAVVTTVSLLSPVWQPPAAVPSIGLPLSLGEAITEATADGLTSDPTAVSWSSGRIDVFARGPDNALWHRWYAGSWSGWESLGGSLASGPDVASWGSGRLDVFVRGTDNTLQHKSYAGQWSDWESLGGGLTSDPSAVSWGPGRLDVFARGGDNALWHISYANAWSGWESLGGVLSSGPDVASWGSGRLDVFARGMDNSLQHTAYGGKWSGWESLGGGLTSDPSAVSWASDRIDVFARGGDNALWHLWYANAWSKWESLGGGLSSGPDASSWGAGRLDVFARGGDNALWHLWYGGAWSPWEGLGAPGATTATTLKATLGDRTFLALPVNEAAPPTGLKAETSPTRISLRWPCLSGPTGFDVYVTPQGGAEVKLTPAPVLPACIQDLQLTSTIVGGTIGSTSTSPTYSQSFTQSGVTPGATYTYVVRALYANGASAASTPITAMANLAPAPSGFVATVSGRSAALQWQSVSGATGYRVFRKQSGQSAFQELNPGGTTATSYGDQTILAPGQHQYYVQAVNGFPSQPATVTIPPWPAPSGLIAMASASMVDLQWNMVLLSTLSGYGPRGPAGYLVFRQRQGEPGYSQVTATPLPALSWQDINPAVGLRTNYYVKGVDGDASAPVAVVPGLPEHITATPYPTWVVDFRWDGTSDATSVRILRAGTPSGPYVDVTESDSKNNWARIRSNPRGGTQHFKILGIYARGTAESAPVAVMLPSQGITNLVARSPSAGTAELTWTCDPFAIGYSLLRQFRLGSMEPITQPGSTSPLRLGPMPCQYKESGLFSREGYNYTVVAHYGDRSTTQQAVVYVSPK